MQHSCSHSNAICHHSVKNRIELHTQTQPLVAKHIGGTNRVRNDRSRTRRTHEVPFIVACSHFTRKNTRFRAPASSPKHSPCNIHAAITMRSATTLHQGQVSIAHHPSRSSLNPICKHPSSRSCEVSHHPSRSTLNRAPPFKVKSQSHTTLQDQVSIAQHPSRSSLNPICNDPSSRSCEVSHHPSRSTLNRAPPFKVKSQSHTTLQDQVSIAHHPFKVKSQSHTTLHTTLQGQVSIAHHPFSIAHHPSRSSLNRTPPFKVKCQSRTTLHHFKTQNSICPYLGSIASQLPLTMGTCWYVS